MNKVKSEKVNAYEDKVSIKPLIAKTPERAGNIVEERI